MYMCKKCYLHAEQTNMLCLSVGNHLKLYWGDTTLYKENKFCKIKAHEKDEKCLEAFGLSCFRGTSVCNQTEKISIPVINMLNMELSQLSSVVWVLVRCRLNFDWTQAARSDSDGFFSPSWWILKNFFKTCCQFIHHCTQLHIICR